MNQPSSSWHVRGRSLAILLAVAATLAGAGAQSRVALARLVGQTLTGTVTSVVDGDTVSVRLDRTGQLVKVRLEGIDTPENGEPFSVQARNATRVMLFDRQVRVKATDLDRYDRLVARITIGGRDSSIALLEAGLACHFTRYSADPALAAAQSAAKAGGRGFWDPAAQKPACAGSRNSPAVAAEPTGPFHGNRQSHVYHSPSCRNYNCKNCTASFATAAEAQNAGYRPAGDCLPAR